MDKFTLDTITGERDAMDREFEHWVTVRDIAQERLTIINGRRADLMRREVEIRQAELETIRK